MTAESMLVKTWSFMWSRSTAVMTVRLRTDTTNAVPLWVLAYPRYVDRRPKRLLVTLLAGGVLPEWRHLVRHHRATEVRRALGEGGLRLERLEHFGPPWSAKWHLWWTRRP